MPSKNLLKVYVENGYYHVYNRGVEKRTIFVDEQDYKVFLSYIKEILSPPDKNKQKITFSLRGQSFEGVKEPLKNYSDDISLIAFCLMPNHYHLLIQQNDRKALEGFMRSLMTRYSMYFNKRHNRVGYLFQGRYKAVLIENENYLVYLSKYIHRNSLEYTNNLVEAYSSYSQYISTKPAIWVRPKVVLNFFSSENNIDFKKYNSYKDFVEEPEIKGVNEKELLADLVLE